MDHHEECRPYQSSHGLVGVAGPSGTLQEPQHVHRRAEHDDSETGLLAQHPMPSIRGDDEVHADLQQPVGQSRFDPDDAARILDQPDGLRPCTCAA